MKAYRKPRDLPPQRQLKAHLGKLIHRIDPKMAAAVKEKPFSQEWGMLGRLARNAHFHEAVKKQDHELLHGFLVDYWSSPVSLEFFDHFGHRFEDLFLKFHAGIVDELSSAIDHFPEGPTRLIELGSGDGRVLEYLAEHLPQVDEFFGLDLNREQIETCQQKHAGSEKLFFSYADVFQWLKEHPGGNTVFFTNGGVLEYFPRTQLTDLFALLRETSSACVVALTETLAIDHELEQETATYPYGHELAFSHNYPAILSESGFEESYRNDRFTEEGEEWHPSRWLQIVSRLN